MTESGDIGGTGPEDDDVLAAECALRLLPPAEQATAEARRDREPAFAARVTRWEMEFAAIGEAVVPVSPPGHIWTRIEAGLAAAPPPRAAATREPLLRRLAFWRGLSLASLAAAAASIVALVVVVNRPAEAPDLPLVAGLAEDDQTVYLIGYQPDTGALTTVPVSISIGADRVPQLWLVLPTGETIPLGILSTTAPGHHSVPAPLRPNFQAGATIAVSIEPPGGSPTGMPTGPIISQAMLSTLL